VHVNGKGHVAVVDAVGKGVWIPPIHLALLVKIGRGGGRHGEEYCIQSTDGAGEKSRDLGTGECGDVHKTA
jgi:hypothetical protein